MALLVGALVVPGVLLLLGARLLSNHQDLRLGTVHKPIIVVAGITCQVGQSNYIEDYPIRPYAIICISTHMGNCVCYFLRDISSATTGELPPDFPPIHPTSNIPT